MNKDLHFQHQENCQQRKGFCITKVSRGKVQLYLYGIQSLEILLGNISSCYFCNNILKVEAFNHLSCPTKVVQSNAINTDTEGAIESVPLNMVSALQLYIRRLNLEKK